MKGSSQVKKWDLQELVRIFQAPNLFYSTNFKTSFPTHVQGQERLFFGTSDHSAQFSDGSVYSHGSRIADLSYEITA